MDHPNDWPPGHQGAGSVQPLYRRPLILGGIAAVVVLLIAVIVTTPGSSKATSARSTTTSAPGSVTTMSLAPVPGSMTTLPATSSLPSTTIPLVTTMPLSPTLPATTAPPDVTSPPTAPPPTALSFCGAPPNPMGYNYCGRGTLIDAPDPRTCDYFFCAPGFNNGKGFLVQCRDGLLSLTGGRGGACSTHRGVLRPLFSG